VDGRLSGVIVLNVVMMYRLMEYNGLLVLDHNGAMFSLGNLLQAATTIEAEAEWWIAATAAPTIILFFFCHAKAWRLRIGGQSIRADLFVVLCFIASIVVGYMLQPLIGNISGAEPISVLLFTWSTIGCALVAFVMAPG